MNEQSCPTSNAHQLRVVQQLLWDVISMHLYPAERDEIRRTLGNTQLDENETLFAEAGALADILGDVQLNTAALLARHQLCSNPQRNMVEMEIRMLIDRLHASAAVSPFGSSVVKERDPDSLLPRQGKRDKAVLEYVTAVAQIAESGGRPPSSGLPPRPPSTAVSSSSRPGTSSRPLTALSASASVSISLPSPLSRPGTASPTLPGSRPSTASSAASSAATRYTDAPSVVAGVADKLNVSSIDAVRETLHTALLDERTALLEDIEYLHGLLDAETDLQVRAAAPPPSLAELKDYSNRLAAVVENEEARVEHEVRVSAMFAAADQQQSKPGRLRGMVDASRRPTSSGGGAAAAVAAVASPPEAALAAGLAPVQRSSISGGAQTLVVHSGVEEALRQRQTLGVATRTPATTTKSTDSGNGSLTPATASSRAAAPLAAVRRPGSGGSNSGAMLAGLSPPAVLRTAAPLPPTTRLSPSSCADSSPVDTSHSKSLSPGAAPDSHGVGCGGGGGSGGGSGGGGFPSSPPSSARTLPYPSPGRLRPTSKAILQAHIHNPNPQPQLTPLSHRDKSPSFHAPPKSARATAAASSTSPELSSSSSPAATGAAASPVALAKADSMNPAVQPVLRPVLPRSGSVGRTLAGGASLSAASSAVAVPASGSTSGSSTVRTSSRVSSTALAGEAATGNNLLAAAAQARSAVAVRLGSSAGTATAEPCSTPVQPRALMGNKQSIVERLDEEVDKVKGGVAAILERYNIRPSTPSSPAAAAVASATAVVAPPPANSRSGS